MWLALWIQLNLNLNLLQGQSPPLLRTEGPNPERETQNDTIFEFELGIPPPHRTKETTLPMMEVNSTT